MGISSSRDPGVGAPPTYTRLCRYPHGSKLRTPSKKSTDPPTAPFSRLDVCCAKHDVCVLGVRHLSSTSNTRYSVWIRVTRLMISSFHSKQAHQSHPGASAAHPPGGICKPVPLTSTVPCLMLSPTVALPTVMLGPAIQYSYFNPDGLNAAHGRRDPENCSASAPASFSIPYPTRRRDK